MTPQESAVGVERVGQPGPGPGEELVGYGVIGLPFTLGDVLAFRRITASTSGGAYTALWHRDAEHRWTIYTTVAAGTADTLYYGPDVRILPADVTVQWTAAYRLAVSVPEHHVEWALRLEPSTGTRLFNALAPVLPTSALGRLLGSGGSRTGRVLGPGPLRLAGTTPSGHRFRILPRRVWLATASAATVNGRDLGPIGPQRRHPRLGGRVLPDHGIFVVGREVYDPLPATSPGSVGAA